MKTPPWYAQAVADHGAKVLGGAEERSQAASAVAAVLVAHPEYVAELAAVMADKDVARWLRERESNGDLFQTALFPLLPSSMRTSPKRTATVASMTGTDLDKAKAMLWNRTENAKSGAERERAEFSAFYDRVRPLLDDGLTVGDVMPRIAAAPQENAA